MTAKKILILCAAVAVCFLVIGMIGNEAYAQAKPGGNTSVDRDIQSRRGVRESLTTSKDKEDDGKGPTKVQMGVGIGSCVVAFIVMKYL